MSLQKVCEELDELSVKYFEILEELFEHRRRIEKKLQEGFLNLSKARFLMGVKAVSSLQYDTTSMCALAHVVTRDEGNYHSFEVCRTKPMKQSERKSLEGSESDKNQAYGDDDAGVRRRRRHPSSSHTNEVETLSSEMSQIVTSPDDSTTTTITRLNVPTNPLLWFGVLVPQPLRHGQDNFIEAVNGCGVMAALQTKLDTAYSQYRSKLRLKYDIINKMKKDGSSRTNGAIKTEEGQS